jgi:hypothetical protein
MRNFDSGGSGGFGFGGREPLDPIDRKIVEAAKAMLAAAGEMDEATRDMLLRFIDRMDEMQARSTAVLDKILVHVAAQQAEIVSLRRRLEALEAAADRKSVPRLREADR